jgi:tRNA pseudouridine38-40 synthase
VRSARLVERGDRIAIALSADSFLHHMVRNIVGSLVEVGRGARPASWMADLLAGRDRTRSGPTAPPQGLMLVRVLYGQARRG